MKLAMNSLLTMLFTCSFYAAAACPDLNGKYETADVVQNGCTSMVLTQYLNGQKIVDEIQFDNVYRVLPSMPQFQTAATSNAYQLIFNSKDHQGKHVRIFTFSLTKDGDFLAQRIVLDGNGNIVTSDGFVDKRIN